nr:hypothetical protein [Haloarcula sp. 1CSR25-25]
MTDQYADYEALRPLGEATHVPDDQLASSSGEPRRQRSGGVDAGYPDDPTEGETECDSCGASIPAGQSKCRFCLTNHLEAADDQDTSTAEQTLLHIIHIVVEASTFYGAVGKGSAAATLLAKGDDDPELDDCKLIYDLDEEPAPQLVDQWPSLPSATRVTSECGNQLLAAARERTAWTETTQSRHDGEHATFLYDETGARFAPKLVLQAFVRMQTTTSGWCQRLRSKNPLTRPIPNSHDASAQTELTSSVESVIGRLSIDSASSRLSPMTSGPGSQCGAVSGAARHATGPNPKPVSKDDVKLTNNPGLGSELLVNRSQLATTRRYLTC